FWEMGPDLRFTWISENIRNYTGVEPAWYLGKRRQELDAGERQREPAWAEHLAILERRLPFDGFVYELRAPDGSRQWTRTSGRPMCDLEAGSLGYRGASPLCTKERQAPDGANHAEPGLPPALAAMTDGFALYDADDRLAVCNEAYRNLPPGQPPQAT